jgi:hypothetical protein
LIHEAKQVACNTTHLNFFSALGDAVAAVMPIDVFEGLVALVA